MKMNYSYNIPVDYSVKIDIKEARTILHVMALNKYPGSYQSMLEELMHAAQVRGSGVSRFTETAHLHFVEEGYADDLLCAVHNIQYDDK